MDLPGGPAERYADALSRKGASVVLRRKTSSAGPTPLLNPPRVVLAVVGAPVPAGAEMVPVTAATAVGRLLVGDSLVINGVAYPVLAEAEATTTTTDVPGELRSGFSVAVAPLPAALDADLPVTFIFGADYPTSAMVNSFSIKLVDGERIKSRDLSVLIAAYGLPDIDTAWSIFVRGREMAIQIANPTYERDEVISWSIQAR